MAFTDGFGREDETAWHEEVVGMRMELGNGDWDQTTY
jgi:hypothetical protein